MTDSVFLVGQRRPHEVDTKLAELMVGQRALLRSELGPSCWSYQDPTGRSGPVEVALDADRLGTLVQVTGLPDEATEAWLVGALGAVQAAPALGARLQLPEPATPLAAAPPTFESDETTRTAPSKRRPVLRFADGAEVVLAGRMLFGRDPSSSPALGGATPVQVDDPEHAVSKTHFALACAAPRCGSRTSARRTARPWSSTA